MSYIDNVRRNLNVTVVEGENPDSLWAAINARPSVEKVIFAENNRLRIRLKDSATYGDYLELLEFFSRTRAAGAIRYEISETMERLIMIDENGKPLSFQG